MGAIAMNKADVIQSVSEKTGIAPDLCEKVLKAFETQAGDALAAKLKGTGGDQTGMLARISQATGVPPADCERVLTAIEEVVKTGIADKLGFLKGLFSQS
jgi:hypothetical protein